MEYFAEIIKNKEAKARALEILRKRNEIKNQETIKETNKQTNNLRTCLETLPK